MIKHLRTFSLSLVAAFAAAAPPEVGQIAPDFSLKNWKSKTVELSAAVAHSPVVLLVLRGFPGYQCPLCNRQVRDFALHAEAFEKAGVRVIMVYPGPPGNLELRAREFLEGKSFPETFEMVLDPDFAFTRTYGLRWDAPNETAYPSTFVIGPKRVVTFAKISREHGGRTTAAEILAVLKK